MNRWWRRLYMPAVIFTAAAMAMTGSNTGASQRGTGLALTGGPLPNLEGNWVGSWEDTKFGVQDTLGFVFTVNGSDASAVGIVGMDPFVLPDEATSASGTIDADTLDFTFASATVSGSGRMVGRDVIDGVGTVGGVLGFGGFTFAGIVGESQWTLNFVFDSPSGGEGVISLSNTVAAETSTWGGVKARYPGDH